MATKPAQICQLQKGKLVDTQKGFVDTFNWAVQAIANLDGGENCEVTWPTDDHPTIDVSIDDSTSDSGGGIEAAVYDVVEGTQEDVDGISVQYTDDRVDTFIPFPDLSAVYDVTADTQDNKDGITISYTDDRVDSFIPFSGSSTYQGPFEIDLSSNGKAKLTNCCMRIARAYFFWEDQTLTGIPSADSIIYVKCDHLSSPSITVDVDRYDDVAPLLSSSWSNALSVSVTPLYRTKKREVVCDYRYLMNVQAYDSRNYTNGI